MFTIIGILVVLGSVAGGFTIAGGKLPALFHVSEIITICGTAAGTMLIATPMPVLKQLGGRIAALMKPSRFSKALYLESLRCLYELFTMARKDGLVAIEQHIENPHKSAMFSKYPAVVHDHHAVSFLCDSLRLVLVGGVPPHDLEALMDQDLECHHEESAKPAGALQKVADALPAIGIVAAVCGIVVTMAAIAGPVEQIGEHVGAALTGTLMGVLIAYGFCAPLVGAMEDANGTEARYYVFLKASVVAFAKGFSPIVSVEFARRAIFAEVRPSFGEMEKACKDMKKAA